MRLILFLLFIHNLMAQPGPIQIQESGIQNYQIQATTPTTTPIAGKQYLYNANNVLSTKDSAGTIVRVNKDPKNILANPDFEQNLDSYTFTAGKAVINTATPLFDKVSVNFDASAVNDVISTVPYLLPIGLQGGTCMAKITYQASDANLSFRVINADNVVIDQGVLQAVTHPTPVHLVFACPPGTATVNQRTLRVQVIQTGTDAALATLDMFYLGELDAQTMAVTEGSQWYYFSAAADINGNFTFPAPTASTNDKTLFTYAGTTLTALKPIFINITSYGASTNNTNPQAASAITCVGRQISYNSASINTASNSAHVPNASAGIKLEPGETCTIAYSRTNTTFSTYSVNITAIPLSQIATVVPTTQTRAGFYAGRKWGACTWSRTSSNSYADFAAVAACGTAAQAPQGHATIDAVTDGQIPKLTIPTIKKGWYFIQYNGLAVQSSTGASCSFRFTDGTIFSSPGAAGLGTLVSLDSGSVSGWLYYSTDQTNKIISLQGTGTNANTNCAVLAAAAVLTQEIKMVYFPDLSDSTEGITVNKMLPIVQGSETVVEELQANTLSYLPTSGQRLDWSTITKNTIKNCGTVTVNDATNRFTYTGTKSCLIDLTCGYTSSTTGAGAANPRLNGIVIMAQGSAPGGALQTTPSAHVSLVANSGDVLDCIKGSGAAAQAPVSFLVLTATSFGKPGVITSDAVVTNSQGTTARKWRTESCYITNNGTAAMASSSCNTWVQSVSRTGAGLVTVNFSPNIWTTSIPNCNISRNSAVAAGVCVLASTTNNLTNTGCLTSTTGVVIDSAFELNCQGIE